WEGTVGERERKTARALGAEAIPQPHMSEPDPLPPPQRAPPPPGRAPRAPRLDLGLIAARALFDPRLRCAWAREPAMRRRAGFPPFSSSRGWPARDPMPRDLRIR